MGKVVNFASLPYKDVSSGVKTAPISGNEGKEMQADMFKLAPGAKLTETVPQGSDRYFFVFRGEASVEGKGSSHALPHETFATLQEGVEFTLTNTGKADAEVISILAPPPASQKNGRKGFAGGITTAHRSNRPVVDIPDQKKKRIQFVDKTAAASERAHAMIVCYVPETVTTLHMHPNAESMFVLLTGKVRFTVNGKEEIIERGQATHFPAGDKHGLRHAEGDVSFLEFHIPGGFTTVRE